MSRIGKKPIQIPSGVSVLKEGRKIIVKGPKGELTWEAHPEINIDVSSNVVIVAPCRTNSRSSALWGTTRARLQNMVRGTENEFEKKLEIEGIGYRVVADGDGLQFAIGFSHPVKFPIPAGIQCKVEKNVITVFGIDKDLVGEVAARIRRLRPPEPYKGKGIRYQGEVIRRKAGKKAVASAA